MMISSISFYTTFFYFTTANITTLNAVEGKNSKYMEPECNGTESSLLNCPLQSMLTKDCKYLLVDCRDLSTSTPLTTVSIPDAMDKNVPSDMNVQVQSIAGAVAAGVLVSVVIIIGIIIIMISFRLVCISKNIKNRTRTLLSTGSIDSSGNQQSMTEAFLLLVHNVILVIQHLLVILQYMNAMVSTEKHSKVSLSIL